MATKIVVPVLCGSEWDRKARKYDTATVVEWKAKEGEQVEKGDVLSLVENDKVICDIEAEASGFLHILIEKDKKVIVGTTVVAFIAETKEELEELRKTPSWELAKR